MIELQEKKREIFKIPRKFLRLLILSVDLTEHALTLQTRERHAKKYINTIKLFEVIHINFSSPFSQECTTHPFFRTLSQASECTF